ncbi:hypothetical protein SDJN03_14334, partial [Cucurbita argyrosperma subsp. sororia]
MWGLSCSVFSYPSPNFRPSFPAATLRSATSLPVSLDRKHYTSDTPFAPEVVKAVDSLQYEFRAVDNLVARNSAKVLKAFQNARLGSHHFGGSTGYGHDEAGGREALDNAFAEIVGAESAIVRSQFFSGTHAITCALFALLRPGDELLAVAGAPYDTLEEVIGKRDSQGLGSLKDFGVEYREVPLAEDGGLDWEKLASSLKPQTKCALIQRSCGYSWRRSLSVDEIGKAIRLIKMQNPDCLVMVDNCYGEFVETIEPPTVGADLIAGSLIKNPGGTLAPCGGYVAGRDKWVKAAAARLSAPGLGVDSGSTPGDIMRTFFQGLFLSPQMVGEAVKGMILIAEVMASKGYKVQPLPRVPRHDTVQAVQLGSRELLLAFCEAVQRSSPVASYTKPVPGITPGYASEVIFADGTFIDGSTSELSCDGPLREPFAVFCQVSKRRVDNVFDTRDSRVGNSSIVSISYLISFLVFSLWLLSQHLSNWRKPAEQKAIVVIILMAPLYAGISYIGLLEFMASSTFFLFLESIKECYEALVISKFLSLLYSYLNISISKNIVPDEIKGREIHHSFPMTLFQPHSARLNHHTLKLLKIWTYQFVVIRPVCSILMISLQLIDVYPDWLSWTFTIILNVSVSLALYSLVVFYHVFDKELKPHSPLAKFLCIKGIVFFCFWQGIVLEMLAAVGIIKAEHAWFDVEHINEAIQNTLVCVEMVFFAMVQMSAYSASPYRDQSAAKSKSEKKEQ